MTYSSFLTVDYVVFTYILTCLCNVLRILKMCTCYFCKIKVVVFPGPRPSAPYVDPRPPPPAGLIKFLSAVFDFLSVYVIKYSCAALVIRICQFSIYKYYNQPSKDRQIVMRVLRVENPVLWEDKQVLRVIRVVKGVLLVTRRVLR